MNTTYANTVNTGCLNGQASTTEPVHGATLVHEVLKGFQYDAETKRDRQEGINVAVHQLTEDIDRLVQQLADYADEYEPVPDRVTQTLEQLALRLSPPARTARQQAAYDNGRAWQEKLHYGRELSDYADR